MNSGSGIQELMAAETRASQIVAEARIGQFPRGLNCYLNFLSYVHILCFPGGIGEKNPLLAINFMLLNI